MDWLLLNAADFLYGVTGSDWSGWWGPMALLAVIVAILLHTVMLMFAKAFSIKELEAFALSEMLQAGSTALMVIFLVFILGGAFDIAHQFIGGSIPCSIAKDGTAIIDPTADQHNMDDAFNAIRCTIEERAISIAKIQGVILSSSSGQFNAFNLGLSIFGITFFKGDWIPSLYEGTEKTRIVNNLATTMLIALDAQSVLILYIKTNMLITFIPLGILLRSFYFTRGPGAIILSIGIGMYFIFPMLFILLDPGFVPAKPPAALFASNGPPLCYPTMSNTISIIQSVQTAGVGTTSSVSLDSMRNDLSKSYVSLVIHPLVSLLLTLVFVRYLMTILGGDSYDIMKMLSKVV